MVEFADVSPLVVEVPVCWEARFERKAALEDFVDGLAVPLLPPATSEESEPENSDFDVVRVNETLALEVDLGCPPLVVVIPLARALCDFVTDGDSLA
jgi:hypothetical protein